MKTHIVLDLTYTVDEGQEDFVGTREECDAYVSAQSDYFMFAVREMSPKEMEYHNG